MATMPFRESGRPRWELARTGLVAAGLALAVRVALPPPDDAAAHLYRTLLARHDILVWDNFWYGGDYPFGPYSLLYYAPAAIVGNAAVAIAATATSAVLFCAVTRREWGDEAIWPARAGAVLMVGPLLMGTYAYALGVAFLLGTVYAVQRRRVWPVLPLAAATAAASPLAFLFLCLVLAAVFVCRPRLDRRTLGVAAALGLVGAAELLVQSRLFAEPGVYPFLRWNLLAVVVVGTLGAAVGLVAARGRIVAAIFAFWTLGSVAAFALQSPLGDNIDRLRYLAFPLCLVAARDARWRPRLLVAAALVASLGYAVVPDVAGLAARQSAAPSRAAFWRPALAYLGRHRNPDYRVEVVQTWGRWEAYYLPRAGYALARGWYRQLDLASNPVLYTHRIRPAAYRAWLDRMAVRYVLLPDAQLDTSGAKAEARLLRSGRSGLERVSSTAGWTIYRVPHPRPLLTGSSAAHVSLLGHDRLVAQVASPGRYLLRIRYMPYWQVRGEVCLAKDPSGMTTVVARRAGSFSLSVVDEPDPLLDAMASGHSRAAC